MKKLTSLFLFLAFLAMLGGCRPTPSPTITPATPTLTPPTLSPTPPGKILLVTSAEDSGPGTLRQALQDAQSGDTIIFDPTVFPPDDPATIAVTSGLPQIGQSYLTIDASDAGVILDGSQLPRDTWIPGLEIISDGNTIRGLQVINFTGTGIVAAFHGRNNTIGGDRNIGAGPIGQGNLASGNDFGIGIWDFASNNRITGNLIGTDVNGAQARGNQQNGVWISGGAHNNVIGPDNVIAYNGGSGIGVDSAETVHNTITHNSIHDNGSTGIFVALLNGNDELPVPIILDFDLEAGALTGATCANCTVEIFSDSGKEGAIYEGQTAADGKGVFTFNKGASFIGPYLTTIATDIDGNSSEFSLVAGTLRTPVVQQENNLPKTVLQLKESRELPDNRMGVNWGSINYNIDWERAVATLNAWGVKRMDMGLYEKEPPIDWSTGSEMDIPPGMDVFIDGLAENGIAMNLMLHFWDKEGYALGEELDMPRFQNQQQIDDFIKFVRFVVRHFKGRIPYYTIWSEPDYCGDGGIKCILPQDYIELVRQVIPVIREEDPQAKIVSAPYVLFFARNDLLTLLKSDVVPLFDVISWHPIYDVTPNNKFFGNFYYEYPSIIREIKQTASAHGFAGEYWGTDLSWTAVDNCPSPGCKQIADHPWELLETDLQVAKYYARGLVMELGLDVAAGSDGFTDVLRPWSFPVQCNLNTVMAGSKPLEVPVEIESDATNITSYGFTLPNGDRLFALWTDGLAVDDDPGVSTTLTFPGFSAQKVIGVDVLHGFEQELIIENENGNLIIRNLLVKDYPIILRLID